MSDAPTSPSDAPTAGSGAAIELTEREQQIADLLVQGLTNKEIATQLFLSTETVKSHVARILRKLGARNRVQAAVVLLRGGFTSPAVDEPDGALE